VGFIVANLLRPLSAVAHHDIIDVASPVQLGSAVCFVLLVLYRYTQNADNTGGFVSPYACVTQAGYGYDGRVSQKCDKGYYNDKDNYAKCKPCGYALTTQGLGAAKATECGIEPGYGFGTTHYFNRTLIKCPVGKFD
jgi:hypothetical protein